MDAHILQGSTLAHVWATAKLELSKGTPSKDMFPPRQTTPSTWFERPLKGLDRLRQAFYVDEEVRQQSILHVKPR